MCRLRLSAVFVGLLFSTIVCPFAAAQTRDSGIDPDGFDVRAADQALRFDFAEPVQDAEAARRELVALAQACRA